MRNGPARWGARWAAGFLSAAAAVFGAEAPQLVWPEDLKIPLWYKDVSVRSSFGYKDNVLLSRSQPRGSALWAAGGDLLVYRLPSAGWRFNAFASFDHVGYLNQATGVSDEEIAMAMAQVTKDLGRDWKMTLGANYTYQHQVFDVSVTETNQFTNGEVLGHSGNLRWSVRKDFAPYWAEAEVSGMRQWLATPLDGFWQTGPRLTVGRACGAGSDLSLSYLRFFVAFDSREQISAAGLAEPGTRLRFDPQSLELAWHQVWDQAGHWHTVTKAGVDFNQDNGSGYFDFTQYRLAEQLKYKAKGWELSAQFRVGYYDFATQTVSPTDAALRQKTLLGAGFRAEKSLGKAFKVFASYSYDQSLSNVEYDRYQADTVNAGVEFRF